MLVSAVPPTADSPPSLAPFEVEALLLTTTGIYELIGGARELHQPLQRLLEAGNHDLLHLNAPGDHLQIRAAGKIFSSPSLFLEFGDEVSLSFTSHPHFSLTPQGWHGFLAGGPYATLEVAASLSFSLPKVSRRPRLRPSTMAGREMLYLPAAGKEPAAAAARRLSGQARAKRASPG